MLPRAREKSEQTEDGGGCMNDSGAILPMRQAENGVRRGGQHEHELRKPGPTSADCAGGSSHGDGCGRSRAALRGTDFSLIINCHGCRYQRNTTS